MSPLSPLSNYPGLKHKMSDSAESFKIYIFLAPISRDSDSVSVERYPHTYISNFSAVVLMITTLEEHFLKKFY